MEASVDEMKIGDFSKTLVPPPKPGPAPTPAPTPAGASPESDRLVATEKILASEAAETEEALQPKVDYEEQLKAQKISLATAAKVVDDVLFKGHYTEEFPVSSRVKVVFRTRQARDTARTLMYLEVAKPLYENHFNEVVSKYSLAGSLEQLGTTKFKFPAADASDGDIEKAFSTRLAFVEGLPDPVLRLLLVKLNKFDEKIRVILQEGAIENF